MSVRQQLAVTVSLVVGALYVIYHKVLETRPCRWCKRLKGELGPKNGVGRTKCLRCGGTTRVARGFAWVPWPAVLVLAVTAGVAVLVFRVSARA